MAHNGDGDPLWVEPMKGASESLLLGERLRLPKQSMMNLRLPRQPVSPREKPLHVKHSPLVETVSADEGSIETSREKARCKSLFMARQLSVFFTPTRYMVIKIMCSSSEVVLRTRKYTLIYLGLCPSSNVIAIRLVV
jgi:hypothetical protein